MPISKTTPPLFADAVLPREPLAFAERLRLCKLPLALDDAAMAALLPAEAPPRIAVVGSRASTPEAHRFTVALARAIARAGGVVVSGGALGIDAAAHEGSLGAGGATWAVVPCGPADTPYPAEHASLFARVAASPRGRMIFAAPNGTAPRSPHFFQRNGLLVALSDAVVVVQAGIPSGALNAAKWATAFGVPLWTVPAPPWDSAFAGNNALLRTQAARPLWALGPLLASVGLRDTPDAPDMPLPDAGDSTDDKIAHRPRRSPPPPSPKASPAQKTTPLANAAPEPVRHLVPEVLALLPESARRALEALGPGPRHVDEIALRSGLAKGALAEALLTLTLETVVEEGPTGFYRTP